MGKKQKLTPLSHTDGCKQSDAQTNRVKMLHTEHNYLFVRHHFQRTNPLIHMNSLLQYVTTNLTSPYYMIYSYIIQPIYCKGTLRNFDPIKNYFLFSPLYAKTNCPILIPNEYLQCVEGGATKGMYVHTFNLLYTDWLTNKLHNRKPSTEEIQILNHTNHTATLTSSPVPLQLARHAIRNSWSSQGIQTIGSLILNSNIGSRRQSYNIGLTDPQQRETQCSQTTDSLF